MTHPSTGAGFPLDERLPPLGYPCGR
jgi:hypothetical protein